MGAGKLDDLIEMSASVREVDDLHGLCSAVCRAYGFDHFLYRSQLPSSLVKPFVLVVNGNPEPWHRRYVERDYARIDPALHHCATSVSPVVWADLLADPELPERGRRMMYEAREFGLVSGTSIPVRGGHGESGLFNVSSGDATEHAGPDIRRWLPEIFLLTAYVHEAACRLATDGALPFRPRELTPRERECLLWAAEGKTSWETALIVGISERTVIFHLRNAMEKLETTSRQQAIARAVAQGLITPQFG